MAMHRGRSRPKASSCTRLREFPAIQRTHQYDTCSEATSLTSSSRHEAWRVARRVSKHVEHGSPGGKEQNRRRGVRLLKVPRRRVDDNDDDFELRVASGNLHATQPPATSADPEAAAPTPPTIDAAADDQAPGSCSLRGRESDGVVAGKTKKIRRSRIYRV